jgi:pSer/pThr/pTyr-binding forkhead associated (FHA) protein/tetratricopeptide (TPR) repeat protein
MGRRLDLIVKRDGHPDERFELLVGVYSMGRAEDNTICLADIGVSRRHARILVDEHGVTFEDLGSGNGTWFMGERVRTQTMVDGDELVIDPFRLCFLQVEVAEPVENTETTGDKTMVLSKPVPFDDHDDAPAVRASIEVLSGNAPRPGTRFDVTSDGLTLGRSDKRDVVLADPAASRLHAEITQVGGEHWIKDPGAANGLFVNGRRIKEQRLFDADVIRIGATEFRFTELQPAAEHTDAYAAPTGQDAWSQPPQATAPEPWSSPQPAAPAPAAPAPPPPAAPPPAGPSGLGAPPPQAGFGAPGFGAPPAGGFGAPPAGAGGAPLPFGGPADAPPPAKKPGFLSKPINMISAGLIVLTIAMVIGKFVVDAANSAPPPTTAGPVAVAPVTDLQGDDADLVTDLMSEGMDLFKQKDYGAATRKFLKVLELDPSNAAAKRMGYITCELIALGAMQDDLESSAASEADRAQSKEDALEAVAQNRKGRLGVGEAREALRQALNLNPGDEELEAASKELDRRAGAAARAAGERAEQAKVEEIKALYDAAKSKLDAGKYTDAVKGFRAVLSADPDRATPYASKAEDGLSKARSEQRKLADGPYQKGVEAVGKGDCVTARTYFRDALRYDPDHAAARTKLNECQRSLQAAAKAECDNGKVYEKAHQTERALSSYAACQRLIADPNHELHRSAQGRINALMQ